MPEYIQVTQVCLAFRAPALVSAGLGKYTLSLRILLAHSLGVAELEKMDKGRESNLLTETLRQNPALLFSLIYMVASTIGMFYSWDFLRRFGIDVFDYAQLSDFLLASLKEPYTWLLAISVVVAVILDNALSRRVGSRKSSRWVSWYGNPRYRYMNFLIAIFLVAFLLNTYASFLAEKAFEGKGKIVDVRLGDDDDATTALLLGTTGQFIFLFDAASGQVTIHPNESIHSISFIAPVKTNSKKP